MLNLLIIRQLYNVNQTTMTMKTILLPTDFSETAQHAADFALTLADLLQAKILVIHAYMPPITTTEYVIPLPEQGFMQEYFQIEEDMLAKFTKDLAARYHDDKKPYSIVESKFMVGAVSDCVQEIEEEMSVDFVVMGTVGASNAWDRFWGTNTLGVVKHIKTPIWVIPKATKLHDIKHLIYMADLEGNEIGAVKKVLDVATLLGADTKVLHVKEHLEPEVFDTKGMINQLEETFEGQAISFTNLYRDDTIAGLDTYVHHHQPDAVVIARREKGLLERIFHKSVISHIAVTSKIPILVLQKD